MPWDPEVIDAVTDLKENLLGPPKKYGRPPLKEILIRTVKKKYRDKKISVYLLKNHVTSANVLFFSAIFSKYTDLFVIFGLLYK